MALRNDSSRRLKHDSNFSLIVGLLGRGAGFEICVKSANRWTHAEGEAGMARFEMADVACAPLGEAPMGAEAFFALGMMYSVGRSVPIDFVSAHKWFNLAAMRGSAEAIRLRREIADQMSEAEIAQAQRAARAWLKAS
jgi:TPR repeat protein